MRVLIALSLSVLSAGVALAQGGIELEATLWRPGLEASVRSATGDAAGDPDRATLDLEADLGMEGEDGLDTRLTFHIGPRSRVRLAYVGLDHSGDAQLARTVEFDGQTFPAGTRVVSTLRLEYARIGWTWQFVGTERVRLGSVVEAKWIEVETTLEARGLAPPLVGADTLSEVLPAVGLALDVTPWRAVDLFAEVTGITAGDRGHVLDAEVGVRLTPAPCCTFVGGYRTVDLRLEDEPDFAEVADSGPFVGVKLRF